jgi:hypothetical protein
VATEMSTMGWSGRRYPALVFAVEMVAIFALWYRFAHGELKRNAKILLRCAARSNLRRNQAWPPVAVFSVRSGHACIG